MVATDCQDQEYETETKLFETRSQNETRVLF